jgi:hypothetical protein
MEIALKDRLRYSPIICFETFPLPWSPGEEPGRDERLHAVAHAALDRAVWTAYGWEEDPAATTDEEILSRLLALNQERAAIQERT